jgi:hypothetical protein
MGEQTQGLGSTWLHHGNFGGTKRDLGELKIYHGPVMSKLVLVCFANSCKTTFGSSIDEIFQFVLSFA